MTSTRYSFAVSSHRFVVCGKFDSDLILCIGELANGFNNVHDLYVLFCYGWKKQKAENTFKLFWIDLREQYLSSKEPEIMYVWVVTIKTVEGNVLLISLWRLSLSYLDLDERGIKSHFEMQY